MESGTLDPPFERLSVIRNQITALEIEQSADIVIVLTVRKMREN